MPNDLPIYLPRYFKELRDWLKTDLGEYLLKQETKVISDILNNCFNKNILILGEPEFGVIVDNLQHILIHPELLITHNYHCLFSLSYLHALNFSLFTNITI